MKQTLYEWDKSRNPRMYKVGDKNFRLKNEDHPCSNCLVRDCRSPEHCDPCPVNPDRERLKKARLL